VKVKPHYEALCLPTKFNNKRLNRNLESHHLARIEPWTYLLKGNINPLNKNLVKVGSTKGQDLLALETKFSTIRNKQNQEETCEVDENSGWK
jgi:hypothetical protein